MNNAARSSVLDKRPKQRNKTTKQPSNKAIASVFRNYMPILIFTQKLPYKAEELKIPGNFLSQ